MFSFVLKLFVGGFGMEASGIEDSADGGTKGFLGHVWGRGGPRKDSSCHLAPEHQFGRLA